MEVMAAAYREGLTASGQSPFPFPIPYPSRTGVVQGGRMDQESGDWYPRGLLGPGVWGRFCIILSL